MDRLNRYVLAGLVAGNLLAWWTAWPGVPAETTADLRSRIQALEGQVAAAEKKNDWCHKMTAVLEKPPGEPAAQVLGKLQEEACRVGFRVTEASQFGDQPVRITLAGFATYAGAQAVVNAAARNPAVLLERITLSVRDDGAVETKLGATVRNGPWVAPPLAGEPPEPIPEDHNVPALGVANLFGTGTPPPPPSPLPSPVAAAQRPLLVYRGYFIETGTPTVMVQENGNHLLIKVGSPTPQGVTITGATPDHLTLRDTRGETWTITMQSGR